MPGRGWSEEDFGKSAVTQSLLSQARASLSPGASYRVTAPQPVAPYELTEAIPADVDALMSRVSAQNAALIEEFRSLLGKDPLNLDAPKWRSQIAEYYWQIAHYSYLSARRAWVAAYEACDEEEGACPPEPQADYRLAIEEYRGILRDYPTYDRLDEVLFRLGDALIRNSQAKEGIGYLHRLTQSYPEYRDMDAAYLAMGEYYFSQKNSGTAQAAYTKVVEGYPLSKYFPYAQYKLAWTHVNLGEEEAYRTAVDLFRRVVESIDARYGGAVDAQGQIDENRLDSGEISFRNQALNDLMVTYAELPQGWREARDYIVVKLPQDRAREKLEQLGAMLNQRGKFEEEIELYIELLAVSPLHPNVPEIYRRLSLAYEMANRMPESEAAALEGVRALLPDGAWAAANAGNGALLASVSKANAAWIYQLAMHEIVAGSEAAKEADRLQHYGRAEPLLLLYLSHYPEGDRSFEAVFSYAFVLDEQSDGALEDLRRRGGRGSNSEISALLPKLQSAAGQYQRIIDWPGVSDEERLSQVRVAANRQVFVYGSILALSDPSWSVVNSAKTQGFVEERRGSAVQPAVLLTQDESAFVRSAEQYALRYPTDEETPAFLWRAAEIYRTRYHYDQAAQRFDAIISHFPEHQYAAVSVGSMFELYHKAQNYEKIEYWALWLLERGNFKHYTAKELQDAAAFAIDKQGEGLAEQEDWAGASAAVLRIVARFPERQDLAEQAYVRALSYDESGGLYAQAIAHIEALVLLDLSPGRRAWASYLLGEHAVRLGRFDVAARGFESAGALFFEIERSSRPSSGAGSKVAARGGGTKDVKSAGGVDEPGRLMASQACLYGAQILMSLGESERGVALLEGYISANADGSYDLYREGGAFVLVPGEENVLVLDRHVAALMIGQLLSSEPDHASARSRLAGAFEQRGGDSTAGMREIAFTLAEYATDDGVLDEAEGVLSWLRSVQGNMSNVEKARLAYLYGRLEQGRFEAVLLEFPIRTLRRRIEQKAGKRSDAEKYYREAMGYRHAYISTAAAYQLAQMALSFRDAFRALPLPRELEGDPAAQEDYVTWLEDELIYPAEDAAASLLGLARQMSVELGSYTDFSHRAAQTLAGLQPDVYPVSRASHALTSKEKRSDKDE